MCNEEQIRMEWKKQLAIDLTVQWRIWIARKM